MIQQLFSPLTIRGLRLRNRIVVPPMHQYSAIDGAATDWHLVNSGKFAAGGAGLVFVESTKVARNGRGTIGDLGLWDDACIAPLSRVASFIKAQGAAAGIQLGHSGRKARTGRPWEGSAPLPPPEGMSNWSGVDDWELVAPSALSFGDGWPVPRELQKQEIHGLVEDWGRAAARAHRAGFDVVEIHAAHGYLIHQFLSPVANDRTDEYGGSEAGRMQFLLEIARSVRAHWPEDKPVFVRLSVVDGEGWTVEHSVRVSVALKQLGVDVIDCSSGGIIARPSQRETVAYGYQVPLAEAVRAGADIMTMAVGLIIHGDQAEAILVNGQADLIGVGREILNNPNWPMDVAQKFGMPFPFADVPPQFGHWLAAREKRGYGGEPSTWRRGIEGGPTS